MRPWIHESELAKYLDDQRTNSRARTPATPTMSHAPMSVPYEDLQRVDQITTALQHLRSRISNSEDLVEHIDSLLEYLQQLRQDSQSQGAEQSFAKLQPLRDLIFWLPPLLFRAGESDVVGLTLLAHVYASALALEPLYPEIGGAYLGSMSAYPLQYLNDALRTRASTQPHDQVVQAALSLIEVPAQILSSYQLRQRQNSQTSQGMDMYRYSPQGSPYVSPRLPMSSSTSDASAYSHSPLHTSGNSFSLPASSYFQTALGPMDMRRGPGIQSLGRAHSMNDRTVNSGSPHSMGMVYGSPAPLSRSSHELSGSRMDYFGQTQAPYNPYGSMNMNTRFVTPSQLWA